MTEEIDPIKRRQELESELSMLNFLDAIRYRETIVAETREQLGPIRANIEFRCKKCELAAAIAKCEPNQVTKDAIEEAKG